MFRSKTINSTDFTPVNTFQRIYNIKGSISWPMWHLVRCNKKNIIVMLLTCIIDLAMPLGYPSCIDL